MLGYQFIHVETYANVSAKKGKPSIQSVVNESMRVDGFCSHVIEPQAPEILYGLNPLDLPEITRSLGNSAKDKLGRKLRKDSPLLLAGVISLSGDSDVDFSEFLRLSMQYLCNKYGSTLKSAVLHLDEPP
ncbi:TPA: hypothetical protein I7141_12895 [Vibrio vulnificus]|nr:hypothetical protein [Vibrio vulnificus]